MAKLTKEQREAIEDIREEATKWLRSSEEPPKEPQEVLSGSIDDRMKALREDHIRMGARAPGDRYVPRR